jgi:hypothetical protein
VLKSLIILSINFFDLLSLELYSNKVKPSSLAMIRTVEVFPIPGGPDIKHALEFGLGASYHPPLWITYFLTPLIITLSQSLSHSEKLSTAPLLPTISFIYFGEYLSVQS